MADTKRANVDPAPAGASKPKKGKFGKRNYYSKPQTAGEVSRDRFLKPGQRGFLVTCNSRQRDCIRDCYRLLNECADELLGPVPDDGETEVTAPVRADEKEEQEAEQEEEEEEDVSVQLQRNVEDACKRRKMFRFQQVESGAQNCLFVSTTVQEPRELSLKIMNDLAETRKQHSRYILRLLPVEIVCRANINDIIDATGQLCDRYFLKEPKSYAIIFNRRFNNDVDRNKLITALADMISSKNDKNKANLKNPDLAVVVEVIKGLCCVSVLPEYYRFRKYNLAELAAQGPATDEPASKPANGGAAKSPALVDEEKMAAEEKNE